MNPFRHTNTDASAPLIPNNFLTSCVRGFVEFAVSSVYSLFKKPEKKQQDDDWEVPFDKITDLVYIGAGAQGTVFRGILNGELVAVKKVRDRKEADITHLKKLNHKNIVRFYGISTATPQPSIIMEFCEYGPLYEFLHSGVSITPKQIVEWAGDVAQGMVYLHMHKIIHRDLKSPNILIADNLVVKVSDFGTSREWNDVSTIMSFTGTVAWMAPEVIRHVHCSEKVDVWSYGVVLWELLTQEIPYRKLENPNIMWGVGTDTIELPIPSTFPCSIQMLLTHCWNQDPKKRPPFKLVVKHLEIAAEELCASDIDSFNKMQALWCEEVQKSVDNLFAKKSQVKETPVQRREDMKQAREMRLIYEEQLSRANELFMEVCVVRLELEERERILAERENALSGSRGRTRMHFKYFHRQTSSSSEGRKAFPALIENRRRRKKQTPAVVNETIDMKAVKLALEEWSVCDEESVENNNIAVVIPKETVVENNGNVVVEDTACNGQAVRNNNSPDIANV